MRNFTEILADEVTNLTDEEKSLIKSNVELLSDEQKVKFADVLKDEKPTDDDRLASILAKIGDVVEAKTKETIKNLGLDKAPDTKMFPSGGESTNEEKNKFVKGLMDQDKIKEVMQGFNALSDEKEKDKYLKTARIGYFFKHLVQFNISKDPAHLEIVKALSEGTDADGGYLTPPEFRAQLIEDLKDTPAMRNLVTVIPMSSDSLELPTLASSVQVTWGSENTSIATTTAIFGTLNFTPYRLNALLYTSRELVADSAIAIVPLITRLFTQKIGEEEDRVIINGSGSGQPKGILQETIAGIDNLNVDADLASNIKKLPFRLGTAYRKNGRWVMNSLSLGAVASLKDDNNQFLYREGIEGLSPHRLAGYPVHEQNDMPLDTLLFGDFGQYFLADRQRMSVETTTEGAGTFEKHQVAIKVIERIDGKVAQVLGFRKITNAGID